MLQYYSHREFCLMQIDVYSYFGTAVFHIWRLAAGQGLFFVAGILYFTQRFVSHHVTCVQVIKKMFGGKLMYKP